MLVFWCMAALAALLLYWKIQTLMERKKEQEAEKAAKAKAAAEAKRAQAKAACQCEDTPKQ